MITLLNLKTKKQKTYSSEKARLILDNPMLANDFKVISGIEKVEEPPEAKRVSIKDKKNKI